MAVVDFSRQVDMKGNDEIVSNERSRATVVPITLTASVGVPSTYVTNNQGTNFLAPFGSPRTVATASNLTALFGDLATGIITINNTAAGATLTLTFDTAAAMVAGFNAVSSGAQVGDQLSCLIIDSSSTASNTITLAAGTNGTFDTNQASRIIPINSSKVVIVRLTNVTSGSEAYTIYF